MPDGKNPGRTVIQKKLKLPAPVAMRKAASLPEANVDMSGIVAEEMQNEVDDADEAPVAQGPSSSPADELEEEGRAAIAAQPSMHSGATTLTAATKPSKKELDAKEAQRKEDAGENDLQDELEVNNANLEEEGKAVMALSSATVETVTGEKSQDTTVSGERKDAHPKREVTILEQMSEKDKLQK